MWTRCTLSSHHLLDQLLWCQVPVRAGDGGCRGGGAHAPAAALPPSAAHIQRQGSTCRQLLLRVHGQDGADMLGASTGSLTQRPTNPTTVLTLNLYVAGSTPHVKATPPHSPACLHHDNLQQPMQTACSPRAPEPLPGDEVVSILLCFLCPLLLQLRCQRHKAIPPLPTVLQGCHSGQPEGGGRYGSEQ